MLTAPCINAGLGKAVKGDGASATSRGDLVKVFALATGWMLIHAKQSDTPLKKEDMKKALFVVQNSAQQNPSGFGWLFLFRRILRNKIPRLSISFTLCRILHNVPIDKTFK